MSMRRVAREIVLRAIRYRAPERIRPLLLLFGRKEIKFRQRYPRRAMCVVAQTSAKLQRTLGS